MGLLSPRVDACPLRRLSPEALPEEGLVHLNPAEGQRALGQPASLRRGKEARMCRTREALTVFSWGQPRP